MDRREVVLDNGVKLLMLKTNKFKTVNVCLNFENVSDDVVITKNNLLMKLLVSETYKHPSRKEFKSYLKDLYDLKIIPHKNILGETFAFSLNVEALNAKYTLDNENLLKKQFEVLNEVLYSPLVNDGKFDETYFKEVKVEYENALIDLNNYKEYVVKNKAREILGDDNKLLSNIEGQKEILDSLTNEDLYKEYLRLNGLCKSVVIVGDFDFEEVINYVRTYLKLDGNRNSVKYIHNNKMIKYEDKEYESKFGQSSIIVAYDMDIYFNDKLYYPALVFNEMFNHYLFKIVREEHNFCYSIHAGYSASKGVCFLQSNIESKNYEMTLKLIEDIISDLKNKLDIKVVNIAKSKIINNMKKEDDSPFKMINREYIKDIYNLTDLEKTIKLIEEVSEKEINEVARRISKKFSVILKEGIENG